jgi:hypothetical protein
MENETGQPEKKSHGGRGTPFSRFFHARMPLVVTCETGIKQTQPRKRCGFFCDPMNDLSVAIPFPSSEPSTQYKPILPF